MKIILTKTHENLGEAGEIINVKNGYARNYLIPRNMALAATKANTLRYEESKKQQSAIQNREMASANEMANEMSKISLTASVQVGEDDKVFGSVTSQEISKLLSEQGFTVDKKDILLDEPIKALGIYNVSIKVQQDVKSEVKLWVVKQ